MVCLGWLRVHLGGSVPEYWKTEMLYPLISGHHLAVMNHLTYWRFPCFKIPISWISKKVTSLQRLKHHDKQDRQPQGKLGVKKPKCPVQTFHGYLIKGSLLKSA